MLWSFYRCLSFRMAICGCIVSWANLATLGVLKPVNPSSPAVAGLASADVRRH